jgi:RNA polymerase sigma factor (sigma-70 family)
MDELPEVPVDCSETDPLLQEKLGRLIAALPEKQRAVLILRFGEDMDADEIGQALNIPVRTVWSHLRRATALIREKVLRYSKERDDEPIRARSS